MNKYILIIFFGCIFNAKADQLAWISFDEAYKAVNYLKKQKEVIHWCACCSNEEKKHLTIIDVYFKKVDKKRNFSNKEYYEVFIVGRQQNGEVITSNYDLAYLHIKKNKLAYNLGLELDFDCDPCSDPFEWLKIDDDGFHYIGNSIDNSEYWVLAEKKEKNFSKIWVKMVKPKYKKKNSKGQLVTTGGNYTMSFININCIEKEYEILDVIEYDSKGNAVKSYKSFSLNKIIPGSVMSDVHAFFCK